MNETTNHPYKEHLEEGKNYAWCTCKLSKEQPWCDGSHKGTGLKPIVFKAERTEEVWLCGCKKTNGAPYCDGSHKG